MVDGGLNDLRLFELRGLEVEGHIGLDVTQEEEAVGVFHEPDSCIIGCRPAVNAGEERVVFIDEGFAVEGECDWDAVCFGELDELFGEAAACSFDAGEDCGTLAGCEPGGDFSDTGGEVFGVGWVIGWWHRGCQCSIRDFHFDHIPRYLNIDRPEVFPHRAECGIDEAWCCGRVIDGDICARDLGEEILLAVEGVDHVVEEEAFVALGESGCTRDNDHL